MKPAQLKALLKSIGYVEDKSTGPGSHEWLEHQWRPRIRWAFHSSRSEISNIEVKRMLIKQAGLTIEEAKKIV